MAISDNEKRLLVEVAKQLNEKLSKAIPLIRKQVQNIISTRIRASEEWSSIQFGKLHSELGVDNAAQRLDDILTIWIDGTKVELVKVQVINNRLDGGLRITGAGRTDFSDTLSHSSAHIQIDNGTFDWLEMLLLAGDRVISDYYYTIPNKYEVPYSRTGKGIMRHKTGSQWSLSPEFKGKENDNFVTRSLQGIENDIEQMLAKDFL